THSGKESHDRDRKTLVERIRELTTRLKDTAASLTRQFQEFTGHVRENTARESSLSQSLHEAEPASRGLEQASKRLEQHSESLSQTVAAKELSQLKENDRGMSL
ncbi:relaxase, partial [Escherichia coli]|nr:relaxase [Escherichia coli]